MIRFKIFFGRFISGSSYEECIKCMSELKHFSSHEGEYQEITIIYKISQFSICICIFSIDGSDKNRNSGTKDHEFKRMCSKMVRIVA